MEALKGLYNLILSLPVLAIWYFWYAESWNWMIICLILAIPVYLREVIKEHVGRKRLLFSLSGLLLYFPLIIYAFARLYEKHGLIYEEKVVHSFIDSLYFSLVTWTTLGYGDFQPVEPLRLWAATEAMIGYMGMALLIAGIYSVLKLRE